MLGTNGVDSAKLNQLVWRVFSRNHGLTLMADAVESLKERLSGGALTEGELVDSLTLIAKTFAKQAGSKVIVDKTTLNSVIDSMLKLHGDDDGHGRPPARNYLHLLGAKDFPRWDYDSHQKQFVLNGEAACVLGAAQSKSAMFRRHYDIVRQRILRTEDFSGANAAKLTPIRTVKGQVSGETRLLFGMLSVIEEDQIYLEDPEESVRLELVVSGNDANYNPSLYTETSMVVVGGHPNGDTFRVDFIAPPPCESRFGSMGSVSHPVYWNEREAAESDLEGRYGDASILIASDVWLDCARTMGQLNTCLERCERSQIVPTAFVFMGPFLSTRLVAAQSIALLARSFRTLAEMIAKLPTIVKTSRFIFMPSMEDPLGVDLLPRFELPHELLQPLVNEGIDCIMASNPCRLYFFSKELVLFRHDLSRALKRNCLTSISSGAAKGADVLKIIIEQAHLCPLPLTVQPRAWEYDHVLTVYPQPHYLVVAEQSRPSKHEENGDCIGVNPGSFATCEFSFSILYPLLGKVEACKI